MATLPSDAPDPLSVRNPPFTTSANGGTRPVSEGVRPPAVHRVLAAPALAGLDGVVHRSVLRAAAARAVERVRTGDLPADVDAVAEAAAAELAGPREVLNATGVALHTNLGRAPWPDRAVSAAAAAARSSDVEWDAATGERGPRGEATLRAVLDLVPEAEAACVVTNGAAALLLALRALSPAAPVVVSRGELVEIGDGFRVPDLLRAGGVDLVEVGATNRTHPRDYSEALDSTPRPGAVVKVHRSNFTVSGFTGEVSPGDLAALARSSDVPVVVDAGSGLLDADPLLPDEPAVRDLLRAGVDLVTFSGDKLLGGPQAGLVVGRADLVQRVRRHPLYRAIRCDKTVLAALWAALSDAGTPVAQALHADRGTLRARTEALAHAVTGALEAVGLPAPDVVAVTDPVGGGCAPGVELDGWAVGLPATLAAPLRLGVPSVAGRVRDGRLLLDLRALRPADDERLAAAVVAALPLP